MPRCPSTSLIEDVAAGTPAKPGMKSWGMIVPLDGKNYTATSPLAYHEPDKMAVAILEMNHRAWHTARETGLSEIHAPASVYNSVVHDASRNLSVVSLLVGRLGHDATVRLSR
jgi:hypothetical protein